MTENEIISATERELERWPGVSGEWDNTRRHNVLTVRFGSEARKVVVAKTMSDNQRGLQNHIGQVRKELRALGAARIAMPKNGGPRRERNKPSRAPVIDKAPVQQNPFEALAKIKVAPVQVQKLGLWQRVKAFFGRFL